MSTAALAVPPGLLWGRCGGDSSCALAVCSGRVALLPSWTEEAFSIGSSKVQALLQPRCQPHSARSTCPLPAPLFATVTKTAKALGAKLKIARGEGEEGESEGEEDAEAAKRRDKVWGKKKRAYYDADNIDLEASVCKAHLLLQDTAGLGWSACLFGRAGAGLSTSMSNQ